MNYAINNCIALKRHVEDGRFDIDNNEAERALRSVVIGCKSWMFAGSQRGGVAAAIFFSLIESCRRSQVNVFAWMRELFQRLPDHPMTRLDEFLRQNGKQQHTDTTARFHATPTKPGHCTLK